MSQPGKDNITEFVIVMQTTVLRIRIRDPVLFNLWIRVPDPGFGWKKIQIRDEYPGSYFLRTYSFGLKILKFNSLMRIRIRDLVNPGSGATQ
jgi:hypothetical protein